METLLTILETILPILATLALGVFARKRQLMTAQGAQGLQQFAINFALPCVLFNSYLTCAFGSETLLSMALLSPLLLAAAVWAFRRARRGGVRNLPMLMSSRESGMLGIPLMLVLFGQEHVFRMAALDAAQALVVIPTIAILSAGDGERLTPAQVAKKVLTSPFLLAMAAGVLLNLTGAAAWLEGVGVLPVITSVTGLIATPMSAAILFSIGYSFSLSGENRGAILRGAARNLGFFLAVCAVVQGLFFLLPDVAAETRWAVLLYCLLPPSFLTPSLGKTEEEFSYASGICSVYTLVTILAFLVMAVLTV